jgi:predicted polyphosphate/ATP-dependent NAD kinase
MIYYLRKPSLRTKLLFKTCQGTLVCLKRSGGLHKIINEKAKNTETDTTLSEHLFFENSIDLLVLIGLDGYFKQVSPHSKELLAGKKKK